MFGVSSGQGKTTLTVYMCVLGVLLGQVKTTLTVYLCIRSGIRSRENNVNIVFITSKISTSYVKTKL